MKNKKFEHLIALLLILHGLVNFIGALGPELGFDALWYHLTIPKLYLIWGGIRHIPGSLLYFSGFPHLTELIYMLALKIQGEELAKIIHWGFGIGSAIVLYKLARRYFSKTTSLLATLMFYSTLIVGWQSITAYVDLSRTFWEVLALSFFLENKILFTGIALGLAVSTKILSLTSVAIFIILALVLKRPFNEIFLLIIPVFLSLAPWLVFNFLNTGNPFYPLFSYNLISQHYKAFQFSPISFFKDFFNLFLDFEYRISPLFLIFLPLAILNLPKVSRVFHLPGGTFLGYVVLSFLAWFLTPRTGFGRFFLPYLPALSLLCVSVLETKFFNEKVLKPILLGMILFFAIFNLFYRTIANAKFLPVILGKQTKAEFLSQHLDFDFGNFYDIDGWFAKNIKPTDLVLVYNIHNLYYLDFPFVHQSWAKEGMKFTHVLVKDTKLPKKFKDLPLIYKNPKTGVRVYKIKNEK